MRKSVRYRKSLLVLFLTLLGLFLAPHSVKAFTLVNRTGFTDADFNKLEDQGAFQELFVAEGRIGNNSLNDAERELGINRNDRDPNLPGLPVTSGQFVWGNGKTENFTLKYTGSSVDYIVGNQTLSTTEFSGPVSDIFLRTFAIDNSTAKLSNLVFSDLQNPNNKFTIGNLSSSGTSSGFDTNYLQISDISAPFEITGQVLLSWTGQTPTRSNLAYQIKVGNSSSSRQVPEPGTTGALLLTGMVGVGFGRRKLARERG
jgi:hypothetical protein